MAHKAQKTRKTLRKISWLGLEPEQAGNHSTFVITQIDGLSEANFQRALRANRLPYLSKLLREKKMVVGPWRALVPTSTAAFQIGMFYGIFDRIPGFFWFGREQERRIRMNNSDDTAMVEKEAIQWADPYPGLLSGGSSYSALFTGGASNTLLTFSRLFSPRLNLSTRNRWIYLFILSQVFLVLRIIYYSLVEVIISFYDFVKSLLSPVSPMAEMKFLFPRIASVVFCREIATLAAILDIYRGVGPIYLNYFSYDEHAHHRGPNSAYAFWTLRGLDASIRRIWKAAQRAEKMGIRSYDVIVMSDHGQVRSYPFYDVMEQGADQHFDLLFKALYGSANNGGEQASGNGRRRRQRPKRHSPELVERQLQRTDDVLPAFVGLRSIFKFLTLPARRSLMRDEKMRERDVQIQFVTTGPLAHMCLAGRQGCVPYEEWLERFPLFLDVIAQHDGVGFTLCRTRSGGCMVGSKGEWVDLDDEQAVGRICTPAAAEAIRKHREELQTLANMDWAGDFLLFGYGRPDHRVVSYSFERGSHGGVSPEETTPFFMVPAGRAEHWPELSGFDRVNLLTLPMLHDRLKMLYQHAEVDLVSDPTTSRLGL